MGKSLANEKLPEETKPKLETNIKEKDEAVKARDNNVVDSDYSDRSICGLLLINHNAVDYIQVTYRSLRGLVGDKLVKAENDNEKRMLKSCREDFPDAKMMAFYCRGNWFLRIRGFVAKIVSSCPKKITGSTGKNNMLYRLPPAMTKEDMLKALNNALIKAGVIRSGSCCKDYLRLKEIDLKSQIVLKDELDDINENEELDDTDENEALDDTDENEELDDTDENEELDDTDENEEMDDTDESEELDDTDESEEMDDTDESEVMDDTDENEEMDDTDESEVVDDTDENEEMDDTDENEELDDTDESEEVDDTDESEDLDDTDEDEDLGDTDQN